MTALFCNDRYPYSFTLRNRHCSFVFDPLGMIDGCARNADMRTRLERDYRFEAAHRLPKVASTHKCHRLHGHSYEVRIGVEGRIDEDLGWLIDFSDLDEIVSPIIEELDHQTLNEIDGLENPTSEILAAWLWRRLVCQLDMLKDVSVSETASSRCIYRGE